MEEKRKFVDIFGEAKDYLALTQDPIISTDTEKWAEVLKIDFLGYKKDEATFIFHYDDPDSWEMIAKPSAMFLNKCKRQVIFILENKEKLGLFLSDIQGYKHHALLRKFVELTERE
jgi:hypothetical protein